MIKNDICLEVKNLITSFRVGGRVLKAVDGISFQVKKGKTLGIVGESGCGKSVTSHSILRLIPMPPGKIEAGSILFNGKDLTKISDVEMRTIRGNKISMIFQEPMTSLNPVYTIGNQLSEVFTLHQHMNKAQAKESSIEMLTQVKIPSPEKRFDDYPHQLSGGMKQRIMIAMALACKPELLIADEPTTALDVTIQAQILALMNQLQEEKNMGVILITHDLGVVAETCDDVCVMYAGKVAEKGTTRQIFAKPMHPYTVGLMRSIPRLGKRQEVLDTIPGMVPSLFELGKGCRFANRCNLCTDICKEQDPELKDCGNERFSACHHIAKL